MPECFAGGIVQPSGIFFVDLLFVILKGLLGPGDASIAFFIEFLFTFGNLSFVSLEFVLGFFDTGLARSFAFVGKGGQFLLVGGHLRQQCLVLRFDGLEQGGGLRDFSRPRRPIENAQVEFINQFGIVGLVFDELGDGVIGIADGIIDGRSGDQRHDRAELEAVDAFAFARALACGAT